MHIHDLASLRTEDAGRVGGKAAGLGELSSLGLPVPRGFVLPARTLPDTDPARLSSLLRSAVQKAGLRAPFAVRSSAAAEDGADASFAGQFLTELGVPTDGLADAVLRCAASGSTRNVSFYSEALGVQAPAKAVAMVSVIVQEQVEAELACIMFTADPLTGDRDTYILEVVQGLGEQLASGRTEPLSLRLGSSGVDVVNRPAWADGALETRLLGLAGALRDLGHTVTEHHGKPQDIELCVTADDLLVPVQARPITSLPPLEHRPFAVDFIPVRLENQALLGGQAGLDKVQLRLVAESADLEVGRAWLLRASPVAVQAEGADGTGGRTGSPSWELPAEMTGVDQISFVLQDPARLGGAVVRRFSALGSRREDLTSVLSLVGGTYDRFTLIATEVRTARLSGLARRFGDRIVIEVGFGAFVPKGVVVTSQYLCTPDGGIVRTELQHQTQSFVIVEGQAHAVRIDETPTMSAEHCRQVCEAVALANQHYGHPSVEFGIEADGTLFLIDFVDEGVGSEDAEPQDLSIISAGSITGRVVRIDDDDALLRQSLEAHFHSNRSRDDAVAASEAPVVVLARLPYLSLEEVIREHRPGSIAFVFRSCSYLSHLSIVLREMGIPAIVAPDVFDSFVDGDLVRLETRPKPLLVSAEVPH